MEHFLRQGLISDSKVLDIRQVDVCAFMSVLLTVLRYSQVSDGKILENEVPVFIITFATQEVLLFRNAKTGEAVVGADNKVEQCTYVAAITRVPEDLSDEVTGGWKVIEVRSTLYRLSFCTEIFLLDGSTECASIPLKSRH
jgi:import inner membrane translocase subunit TIM44